MMKHTYIAALALIVSLMASCSKGNDFINEPGNNEGVVTMTTTVDFGDADFGSKELTSEGVKTFAVGEKIAVVYTNTSNATVKVESAALVASDISADAKSANFKVTMTNPKPNGAVTYIYPAAMAKADGTPNLAALNNQDGTLASLSSTLDYAKFTGSLTAEATLPTNASLINQLSICKFTIKRSNGNTNITNTVTQLIVTNGGNTYTINRSAAAGPIYVAMQPVTSGNIELSATAGDYHYEKTVTDEMLSASSIYTINVTMNLVQTYGYTGAEQTFTVPTTGYYTLEVWGAQGGGITNAGGKGGYSTVVCQLTSGSTVYIYCGGQGAARSGSTGGAGGWNGGGRGGDGYSSEYGGGGATHIATSQIGDITTNNALFTGSSSSPTARTGLLLVAGGGGGGAYQKCYAGIGGGDALGPGTNAQGKNNYSSGSDVNLSSGSHGLKGRDGTSNNADLTYGGSGGHGSGFTAVASLENQYQTYGGFGGKGWIITSGAYNASTTAGQRSVNGQARITWYGTSHP